MQRNNQPVPAPSATVAAIYSEGSPFVEPSELQLLAAGAGSDENFLLRVPGERLPADADTPYPQTWANDTTLITSTNTGVHTRGLHVFEFSSDYKRLVGDRALLPPDNGRDNWSPVASPTGQQVAFLSRREGATTTSVYVTTTSGDEEPRLVADLPDDMPNTESVLIGWKG